jgi:hypothetical protein
MLAVQATIKRKELPVGVALKSKGKSEEQKIERSIITNRRRPRERTFSLPKNFRCDKSESSIEHPVVTRVAVRNRPARLGKRIPRSGPGKSTA